MRRFSSLRCAGALIAGMVFVAANAEPVLCAAVHHAEAPAADAGMHHGHVAATPSQHGAARMHEAPSQRCHAWMACCLSATGIATPFVRPQQGTAPTFVTRVAEPPILSSTSVAPATPPPRV